MHVDFAGPFKGGVFFVLIDAYSKWPEVVEIKTITSKSKKFFASNGIPEQMVSDNGPQFAVFMKGNRIKHIRSTVMLLIIYYYVMMMSCRVCNSGDVDQLLVDKSSVVAN